MALTDDLRKTLTDPTPLYFAAGSADLALQQARKVPGLVDQLVEQAPERFETVRRTDPKAVQEMAAGRAREAQESLQTKVTELLSTLDTEVKNLDVKNLDVKKLGENAQGVALRGVGVAFEYAVKAREAYEKVAEHGEQAVRTWRGGVADEITELAVVVEPEPPVKTEPASTGTASAGSGKLAGSSKAPTAKGRPVTAATGATAKKPAVSATEAAVSAPTKKTVTSKTTSTPASRKPAAKKSTGTAAGGSAAKQAGTTGSTAKPTAKSTAKSTARSTAKKQTPPTK